MDEMARSPNLKIFRHYSICATSFLLWPINGRLDSLDTHEPTRQVLQKCPRTLRVTPCRFSQ